jgi:acyl-CoA thioesterase
VSKDFDEGIALVPLRDGVYRGHLDRSWWIDRGPNGGYLASLVLAALQREAGPKRLPASLSVHYLDRPEEGDVDLHVRIERVGRSITNVSGRLVQGDRSLALGLGTFSEPRRSGSFEARGAPPVPSPDHIPVVEIPEELIPPFARHFEYRQALGGFPYSGGNEALVGGWMRSKEPRVVDSLMIPTFADGWFPAVFARLDGPIGVPTLELTVHFRSPLPAEDAVPGAWTLCRFESLHAGHGYIEESGDMWSAEGRLIAQSRQLALYRDDVSYWPGS